MGKSELQGKSLGQVAHKRSRSSFPKLSASFLQIAPRLSCSRNLDDTAHVRPSNIYRTITVHSTSGHRPARLPHHDAPIKTDIAPLIPRRFSSRSNCAASDIQRISPRRYVRRPLPDLSPSPWVRGSHNAIFPPVFDEPAAPPPQKVLSAFSELSSRLDKPPRRTMPGYSRTVDVSPTKPLHPRSGSTAVLASLARIRLESSARLADAVSDPVPDCIFAGSVFLDDSPTPGPVPS